MVDLGHDIVCINHDHFLDIPIHTFSYNHNYIIHTFASLHPFSSSEYQLCIRWCVILTDSLAAAYQAWLYTLYGQQAERRVLQEHRL